MPFYSTLENRRNAPRTDQPFVQEPAFLSTSDDSVIALTEKILIPTSDGVFTAYFSEHGLVRLEFPSRGSSRRLTAPSAQPRSQNHQWFSSTKAALDQALHGCAPEALPPLDLGTGTSFQTSVWKILSAIPPGKTLTYTQVAVALGRPKATRAVGNACGANPIPVLIPCHRVLAAQGGLGGFSGGLSWKVKLLGREGVRV